MMRLRVLAFRSIRSRFISYLIDRAKDNSNTVVLEHNQLQLAEYLGVTRPALSKEIKKLSEEGYISFSRGTITLHNKQALASLL